MIRIRKTTATASSVSNVHMHRSSLQVRPNQGANENWCSQTAHQFHSRKKQFRDLMCDLLNKSKCGPQMAALGAI